MEGNPRCYAKSLGNCNGPITKEHYISENILSELEPIAASAVPWLGKNSGTIALKHLLKGECLCEYHNAFLSPLDSLAGEAFRNFARLLDPAAPDVFIWGPSLARWYLKILVGIVGAKHVTVDEKRVEVESLPKEWIEILFGKKEFPGDQGLYMTPLVGGQIVPRKGFRLATLLLEQELRGLRFELSGIEFILCMADPKRAFNPSSPGYRDILFQPKGMNLDKRDFRIRIFWD